MPKKKGWPMFIDRVLYRARRSYTAELVHKYIFCFFYQKNYIITLFN